MRHFPRAVYSDHDMSIITWAMEFMGLRNIPSVKMLKAAQERIHHMVGILQIEKDGVLGHRYTMGSIPDILGQVCQHLIWFSFKN